MALKTALNSGEPLSERILEQFALSPTRCEIPAPRSSMLLSVRFGTNSAMSPNGWVNLEEQNVELVNFGGSV